MNEIGLLWQTDTITPAHEHFFFFDISNKNKAFNQYRKTSLEPTREDKVLFLYLPINEIS
jgi:hypothetical protein